ncbi:inactive carboxylesterase 4 [Cercophora newfieldiana]|uniref:Carboxylic ester hydrolase n=1 Tax=Cercophora newfieldiana TaxID=92897 RepID=A0AA39Y498_9PEZI|nr:inactive carboxylesterase 4 [Cercophora newfieldiana]
MRPASPTATALRLILALTSLTQAQQLTIPLPNGASYTSVYNPVSKLNIWRGLPYAAPPLGNLRWQAPRDPPVINGTGAGTGTGGRVVVVADKFGPRCPQAMPAIAGMPFVAGDEDCLYLSVYSPAGKGKGLPVLVMFHGGGYGAGDGSQDMSGFLGANGNGIVAVVVQYRLGAFGFLASPEVKRKGVLNAGLLDQNFALQWVQKHISKFGGDPEGVTIAGESAGAGSVLLHALARNGELGTSLFKNIISASPWVPTQPYYDEAISIRHYNDFATAVGCSSREGVFDCLVSKDSLTLQRAANKVSTSAPTPRGNWAFIPVTDGTYVPGPPSTQLAHGKLNGLRLLVGNNANEGSLIPPPNIVTQNDLVAWIKSNFANLSERNITSLLAAYPSDSGPVVASTPRYETNGYGPGTAVNISQVATGQQQRCYNMYAEASVICPSYWFASAFTGQGRTAYHYQYSVPFAVHGADLTAYWGPATENQGPDLVTAFRKIYGNFIVNDNPSLSAADANGASSSTPAKPNPITNWPPWTTTGSPILINLNQTGGTPYTAMTSLGISVTQFRGPGLRNNFTAAEAYPWEGGRGKRCDLWREISIFVPQ